MVDNVGKSKCKTLKYNTRSFQSQVRIQTNSLERGMNVTIVGTQVELEATGIVAMRMCREAKRRLEDKVRRERGLGDAAWKLFQELCPDEQHREGLVKGAQCFSGSRARAGGDTCAERRRPR